MPLPPVFPPVAPSTDPAEPPEPHHEFLAAYDAHLEKIYRYIFSRIRIRELAQDLTSDVFTRAWAFVKKGSRVTHWAAFLYTLAGNSLKDFYRSKHRRVQVFSGLDPAVLEKSALVDPELDERYDRERSYETMLARVNTLKQNYRQTVFLRFVEGYSNNEIAKTMGKSPTWVRVTLHRALKKLRVPPPTRSLI